VAGILVTIGIEAKSNNGKLCEVFTDVKDLDLSDEESSLSFCISKFFRKNGVDTNIYKTDDTKIWAVGTVIYRRSLGKHALKELEKDLESKGIDQITDDLDGPFCLVIQKTKLKRIYIITDHAGIINIYRYHKDKSIIISTSGLALSRSFPVTPNKNAICQFLRTASICDSDTIYNEIELLEAGTIYMVDYETEYDLKLKKRYWKSPTEIDESLTFEAAKERVANQLIERMGTLVGENLISDFTAGFDSRMIVSALANVRNFPKEGDIHTFVFGPPESREVNLVKEICNRLGFNNVHLTLPGDWTERFCDYILRSLALTDGDENIFTYAPILRANELKAENHSLALNGLGGELYRDFWWIQEVLCSQKPANYERLVETRVLQYEYNNSVFSDKWRKEMKELSGLLKRKYMDTNAGMDLNNMYNTLQIDSIYFRQKIRRWAGRTISTSNQIIRAVAPLTLKKCLEAGMTIPPRYKRNGLLVRAVVERLYPKLAEENMLNGTPCQNLRPSNIHKFFPLIPDIIRKGIRKVSQKAFGKTIFLDKTLTYSPTPWYVAILCDPRIERALTYDEMATKNIYDKTKFSEFIKRAKFTDFPYYHQLGNMITLELRMKDDKVTEV